jgi:hypothetical protein
MSTHQITFEGVPEPSIEARLGELDDAYLELLRGKQSGSAVFDNEFDNAFDNSLDYISE